MKRFIAVIMTVIMMLGLAACGSGTPSGETTDAPAAESFTPAPADTTPVPTPADASPSPTDAAPSPTPSSAEPPAIVKLRGFGFEGSLYSLCPAGGERAVIQYGALTDDPDPADRYYQNYIALFDAGNDELLYKTAMQDGYSESLLGARKDGAVVTYDMYAGKMFFYREDLTFDREANLPAECAEKELFFDRESDRIFCCAKDVLYEVSPDGSASVIASFGDDAVIKTFDPKSGIIIYEVPDEDALSGRRFEVYDVAKDSVLFSEQTGAGAYLLRDGQLMTRSVRPMPSADGLEISDYLIATLYDKDFASAAALNLGGECGIVWENGYVFGLDYDRADITKDIKPKFADFAAGKAAIPALDDEDVYDIMPCFLEDGRCLLAALCQGADTGGMNRASFHIADPARLDYTETLPETTPDNDENARKQLEENKAVLRRIADDIENEFDVAVLLGDDCMDVTQPSTHKFTSTDAEKRDISSSVCGMLGNMRGQLAMYPEGFFSHFADPDGNGGMRILMISHIDDGSGSPFPIIGCFYYGDPWYCLAVDVTHSGDVTAVVHHELWHAVERRIWSENYDAFRDDLWMALNPPGFDSYLPETEYDHDAVEKWMPYLFGLGDDPYFAREYSLEDPKEDRATLIEMLYNFSIAPDAFSSAEALSEYPHLKAKLDYMAEKVRTVFGAVYWERH